MASRSNFAAPLLLAVVTGLIVYVSLYPFRFAPHGPTFAEALQVLTWARASRGDMFNNVLLYVPFGFCVALLIEPRLGAARWASSPARLRALRCPWASNCCRLP